MLQYGQQRLNQCAACNWGEEHRQQENCNQPQQDGFTALGDAALGPGGMPGPTVVRWYLHDPRHLTSGRTLLQPASTGITCPVMRDALSDNGQTIPSVTCRAAEVAQPAPVATALITNTRRWWLKEAITGPYLGISTVSMTWITPLSAAMSAVVTLAASTVTPPAVAIVRSLPCTVLTLPGLMSFDMTLPETTW